MKTKHLALILTLQLCHILSLQPPDPTHFTPQSSLIMEKSFRNVMTSLAYTYGTPPLPTVRLMVTAGHCMPRSQTAEPSESGEEEMMCREAGGKSRPPPLHSGPQLVLEYDQDFQQKHWCSQRSGTRAAEQVKRTVNLSRSLIRCKRKTLCTQYSYWSYK